MTKLNLGFYLMDQLLVIHKCGAGGILFLKDDHFFTFKAKLGIRTNILAKLYALKLLLILALDKKISKI